MQKRNKKFRIPYLYLFMTPATILIVMFFLIPVILTVLIGFTAMDYRFNWDWVGLGNYYRMLSDMWARKILNNTIFYVITTLACFNVGMALVISLLTTHVHDKVGSVFRALWLLPRITPSTVYIVIWNWATAEYPYGLFNWILVNLGLMSVDNQIFWKHKMPWVWISVILVNGFIGASFGMIIFTSAIKSIPIDFINAAKVDGASTLQTIRYVILPLIKWPILFVTTYQTLSLLTSYEQILLFTNGGPGFYTTEVWALYAYHKAFQQYAGYVEFGYGAALATVLVIIGLIASIIYWRVFKFEELMYEAKIEVV
ncbi:MAG: sugar ABC transporter permease [Chloroflexi bacterium]|nr:MAG: sugar ABC transporter permease [Chloroflexota bacterium]